MDSCNVKIAVFSNLRIEIEIRNGNFYIFNLVVVFDVIFSQSYSFPTKFPTRYVPSEMCRLERPF